MLAFATSFNTSALILLVFVSLFSPIAQAMDDECSGELVTTVGKHFKLKELTASSEKVITQQCKPWPTDTTKTLALFVYDDNTPKKRLILALGDSKTNAVLSSYSGWMLEEDATTRVGSGSASLDTAHYVLSRKKRAFGIILNTTWLPCAVEGGTNEELQLFVIEGKRIRPIFENSMPIHYWGRETTDCFNPGKTFSRRVKVAASPSASNGFFDLTLTADESAEVDTPEGEAVKERALSYTVPYDGKSYDLSLWYRKLNCWSDKTDCPP
jgi:hypothetical protein